MCGIIGYIGKKKAWPIIISGLKRLEYRGYDSAGVALLEDSLSVYKCKGKVERLEKLVKKTSRSQIGVGHTRWATHGVPNEVNAHPHLSGSGRLALVHNGIVENYLQLKRALIKRGHRFVSETDTEVLAHLVEQQLKRQGKKKDLARAVCKALQKVVGSWALAVISLDFPDQLVVARKGSPLLIGVGQDELFFASDASPLAEHSGRVIYLEDEQLAVLSQGGEMRLMTLGGENKRPRVQKLNLKLEALEKGGFDHFMAKEIFEQPTSLRESMRGRVDTARGKISLKLSKRELNRLLKARRIILIACGTAYYAGLVGEYLLEDLAQVAVEVEYASEFRYRKPLLYKDDLVIAVSQSGETADTLAAVELTKSKGVPIWGICNVVGSSLSRIVDVCLYTQAGPEISVASTKAFTAQISVLTQLALFLSYSKKKINKLKLAGLLNEFSLLPQKVEKVLNQSGLIKKMVEKYKQTRHAFYLGRGYGFPVALEGAMKLKETSYIHAEGYPAAEMKHGPIALIDKQMLVVVVASKNSEYKKLASNVQEVKARQGRLVSIVSRGDKDIAAMSDDVIEIPKVADVFMPILATIPLQLFAYHMAATLGCNVDQPRNLAKSVTVE